MMSIDNDLKKILVLFLVYKIFILSLGTVSYYILPDDISHKNTELQNPITRPWHQFDTRAYMNIAENGYNYEYGKIRTKCGIFATSRSPTQGSAR